VGYDALDLALYKSMPKAQNLIIQSENDALKNTTGSSTFANNASACNISIEEP
jgi:hypothetical protein